MASTQVAHVIKRYVHTSCRLESIDTSLKQWLHKNPLPV